MLSFGKKMKVFRVVLFASVLFLLVFAGCSEKKVQEGPVFSKQISGEEKGFPSYSVTRTTVPIVIDGKLDEADWKRAEERTMLDAYTGGETPQKSTFRMLWDDKFLYVGVYFEDHDAWATYTGEDDPLWEVARPIAAWPRTQRASGTNAGRCP